MSYLVNARDIAAEMAGQFLAEIIERWLRDDLIDELIDEDMNVYHGMDRWFNESTDKEYSPRKGLDLIEELSQFREEERELWAGKDYEAAISIRACYTFKNAVRALWSRLTGKFDDDSELEGLRRQYHGASDDVEQEMVAWDISLQGDPPDEDAVAELAAQKRKDIRKQIETRMRQIIKKFGG